MRERMDRHCETCAWWAEGDSMRPDEAQCRRRAPVLTEWSRWPITHGTDWCGDWAEDDTAPTGATGGAGHG